MHPSSRDEIKDLLRQMRFVLDNDVPKERCRMMKCYGPLVVHVLPEFDAIVNLMELGYACVVNYKWLNTRGGRNISRTRGRQQRRTRRSDKGVGQSGGMHFEQEFLLIALNIIIAQFNPTSHEARLAIPASVEGSNVVKFVFDHSILKCGDLPTPDSIGACNAFQGNINTMFESAQEEFQSVLSTSNADGFANLVTGSMTYNGQNATVTYAKVNNSERHFPEGDSITEHVGISPNGKQTNKRSLYKLSQGHKQAISHISRGATPQTKSQTRVDNHEVVTKLYGLLGQKNYFPLRDEIPCGVDEVTASTITDIFMSHLTHGYGGGKEFIEYFAKDVEEHFIDPLLRYQPLMDFTFGVISNVTNTANFHGATNVTISFVPFLQKQLYLKLQQAPQEDKTVLDKYKYSTFLQNEARIDITKKLLHSMLEHPYDAITAAAVIFAAWKHGPTNQIQSAKEVLTIAKQLNTPFYEEVTSILKKFEHTSTYASLQSTCNKESATERLLRSQLGPGSVTFFKGTKDMLSVTSWFKSLGGEHIVNYVDDTIKKWFLRWQLGVSCIQFIVFSWLRIVVYFAGKAGKRVYPELPLFQKAFYFSMLVIYLVSIKFAINHTCSCALLDIFIYDNFRVPKLFYSSKQTPAAEDNGNGTAPVIGRDRRSPPAAQVPAEVPAADADWKVMREYIKKRIQNGETFVYTKKGPKNSILTQAVNNEDDLYKINNYPSIQALFKQLHPELYP